MKTVSITHLYSLATLILLGTLGVGGDWFGLSNPEISAFFLYWSLGFGGLTFLHWKQAKEAPPPLSWSSYFLIAFFVWGVLGYFYSVKPELSLDFSLKYLAAIVLLLSYRLYTRNPEVLPGMFRILIGLAVGHGVFSWIFHVLWPGLSLAQTSLFLSPNFYADYLLFPQALCLYFVLTGRQGKIRWTALACFIFLGGNVWLTGSRGGVLAGGVLTAIVLAHLIRLKDYPKARWVAAGWVLGFVVYRAAFFGLSNLGEFQAASELMDKAGNTSSLFVREMFWVGAWRIFLKFPITGSGPWTYKLMYPFEGLPTILGSGQPPIPVLPHHAHNLFFQTASDMGLLGLGLLTVCLVFWFRFLLIAERDENVHTRSLAACLGAGLAAFTVHNLFENCWPTPVFFGTFTLWAVMTESLPHPVRPGPLSRGVFQWGALALLLAGLFILIAQLGYNNAMRQVRSQTLPIAERLAAGERAQWFCPACDFPNLNRAFLFSQRFEMTGDCLWLARAEKEIRQAVQKSPFNPEADMLLGIVRELEGSYPEARALYLQAYYHGRDKKAPRAAMARVGKRYALAKKTQGAKPVSHCRAGT